MKKDLIASATQRATGALDSAKATAAKAGDVLNSGASAVTDAAAKVANATASTAGAIASKAGDGLSAGASAITDVAGKAATATAITTTALAAKASEGINAGATAVSGAIATTAATVAAKAAIAASGVSGGLKTTADRIVETGATVATMARERHDARQADIISNTEARRAETADKLHARKTWRRVALLSALAAVLIGAAMLFEPVLKIVHTLVQRLT
jgi:hypothetical protein